MGSHREAVWSGRAASGSGSDVFEVRGDACCRLGDACAVLEELQ